VIVQPSDIFKLLRIKDEDEAKKILTNAYNLLLYLQPGDQLQVPSADFEKISHDLLYLKPHIKLDQTLNTLEKSRIINLVL